MQLAGFIGPSATARSSKAVCDRSVNVFCERVDSGTGLSGAKYYLLGTPGLKTFSDLHAGVAQGLYEAAGRCFAVCGGRVFEVFIDGTNAQIGGAIGTLQPASMAANPKQLIIVVGPGYIVNLQGAATLTPIPWSDDTTGFTLASTVTFQDAYFIVSVQNAPVAVPNSAPLPTRFFISGLNDGFAWNGLDFGAKQGANDPLACVLSTQKILWLIGTQTCEPWWNSGAANFPFLPIQGMLREVGTAAYMSPAVVGSELCWLAQDKRGTGYVVSTQNVNAVRISTYAVENAIQQYLANGAIISDAVGSSYQEDGHLFYKLDLPNAGATWVFDATERLWHERGFWDSEAVQYRPTLGRYQCFCFGKHLTLSDNGKIYQQDAKFYDDDGIPIRRLRRAPHLSNEGENLRFNSFTVEMQRGTVPQDVDPLMIMRYSSDGGFTWSNERQISAGKVGEFNYPRVRWRMTGSGRDRVYEVSTTMASQVALIAAYIDTEPSTEKSG